MNYFEWQLLFLHQDQASTYAKSSFNIETLLSALTCPSFFSSQLFS